MLKQVLGKPIVLEYEITGVKPDSYVEAEPLQLPDGRKKSTLRVYSEIQEDAATEFLKQDNGNEPERNIRGQPIPEEEALSGASITKTAIRREIELWKAHPLLSQYLPHEEPTGA